MLLMQTCYPIFWDGCNCLQNKSHTRFIDRDRAHSGSRSHLWNYCWEYVQYRTDRVLQIASLPRPSLHRCLMVIHAVTESEILIFFDRIDTNDYSPLAGEIYLDLYRRKFIRTLPMLWCQAWSE
ncbi:hypothetical protein TNCV_474711 [Trichonephila clavipes]|nr:hypothetical protein TNCV_474711 [Trichonephila clavipes]